MSSTISALRPFRGSSSFANSLRACDCTRAWPTEMRATCSAPAKAPCNSLSAVATQARRDSKGGQSKQKSCPGAFAGLYPHMKQRITSSLVTNRAMTRGLGCERWHRDRPVSHACAPGCVPWPNLGRGADARAQGILRLCVSQPRHAASFSTYGPYPSGRKCVMSCEGDGREKGRLSVLIPKTLRLRQVARNLRREREEQPEIERR